MTNVTETPRLAARNFWRPGERLRDKANGRVYRFERYRRQPGERCAEHCFVVDETDGLRLVKPVRRLMPAGPARRPGGVA